MVAFLTRKNIPMHVTTIEDSNFSELYSEKVLSHPEKENVFALVDDVNIYKYLLENSSKDSSGEYYFLEEIILLKDDQRYKIQCTYDVNNKKIKVNLYSLGSGIVEAVILSPMKTKTKLTKIKIKEQDVKYSEHVEKIHPVLITYFFKKIGN